MNSSLHSKSTDHEKYYRMALQCLDKDDYYNGAQYMLRASKLGHPAANLWVQKERPIEKMEADRLYKLGLSYSKGDHVEALALPKMIEAAEMGHEKAKEWIVNFEKNVDNTNVKRCPQCGKPMVQNSDLFGTFLACKGYPDCKYTELLVSDSSSKKTRKGTGCNFRNIEQKSNIANMNNKIGTSLSVEELIDKAQDQYNRQRYEESLVSAEAAIEIDHESVNGWWFAALCHLALGDNDNALEALEIVVDLAPDFANGLERHGATLLALGLEEEAQYAFEMAIEKDDSHVGALTALAKIYKEKNTDDQAQRDKEIIVLSRLNMVEGWLTTNQLNRLGILHYKSKNFFDAIKYWGQNILSEVSPANLFNLGLVYNHPEISQDADAIDIWRLTRKRFPDYVPVVKAIDNLLPRLVKLSEEAMKSGKTILDQKQWYQFYINPFELIDLQEGQFQSLDEINVKMIQKLKKQLIQEIELENGDVTWIEGLQIDRSKAIGVCDALNDETKREFHWQVFINKPLLGFLSRGEHLHFTVDEEWSPIETIEYLENDANGFREWLSESFTKQFDLVLSAAIDKENLAVLEALLDGRRWIAPSYTTRCFESAQKKIDHLLEGLREAEKKADQHKPTVSGIDQILAKKSLLQILNLFPTFFWNLQNEAVGIIRNIAVSCYNNHTDSDLSKNILNLSKKFIFKSADANKRVQEDFEAIENIIKEERKAEVFLVKEGEKWEITKDGIRKGKAYIPSDSVFSVRWGAILSGDYSIPDHNFLFVFKGINGVQIKFHWIESNAQRLISESQRLISKNKKKDKDLNNQFIEAILHYIFPGVIDKIKKRLSNNKTLQIGHCSINKVGIEFKTKGWFFSKSNFIPWQHIEFDIDNGELVIKDAISTKIQTTLSLREVDNAVVLQFLPKIME
jgi:ssDNA-binding Zn-finger/Zn-ribbon topoisomerase 1